MAKCHKTDGFYLILYKKGGAIAQEDGKKLYLCSKFLPFMPRRELNNHNTAKKNGYFLGHSDNLITLSLSLLRRSPI